MKMERKVEVNARVEDEGWKMIVGSVYCNRDRGYG